MSLTPSAVQLISLMCFAQVFSMSGTPIFPALLPTFVNIWGLTNTDAGWINGIYFAGHLIAVPVLVSLTDRTSPRKIYFFCLGLGALQASALLPSPTASGRRFCFVRWAALVSPNRCFLAMLKRGAEH
ncbi:MAG: MFS transporter [Rhodospirillales bacterium]